jgi:hypothetical protein
MPAQAAARAHLSEMSNSKPRRVADLTAGVVSVREGRSASALATSTAWPAKRAYFAPKNRGPLVARFLNVKWA